MTGAPSSKGGARSRRLLVSATSLLLAAAGPTNSFLTVTPLPDFGSSARAKKAAPPSTAGDYTAAPTPNHDIIAPTPGKQSQEASVSPGFFTRQSHNSGDGYLPSSSLQAETDSKARPGAGINLSMPLQ